MFQYNLKSLLLAMLAAAVLTWFLFVLPSEIGVVLVACVFLVIPSAVLAGILYFRGYPQAFCIGCVPPLLILGLVMLFDGPPWRYGPNNAVQIKITLLVSQLVIIGGGTAAAGVRRLAIWSQQSGAQAKTFPGLPLDMGRPPPNAGGSAGASPSRPATLNPEP